MQPHTQRPGESQAGTVWRLWFAAFIAVFALYATTASRGAQWQDSGERILRVLLREPASPLGLALNHPVHHYLGRLFVSPGLLEPAFAVTLVSALGGALAIANLALCVHVLTGRWGAAVFAGASLAVAHTFWQLATITEVYTLGAAVLAAECWLLAEWARKGHRRWIWLLLLVNGVGVANHLQAGLTTPILAAVVLFAVSGGRLSAGSACAGAALWLMGASPYLWQVVTELASTGDLPGTMRSALFGNHYGAQVLNTGVSGRLAVVAVGFPLLNFPNLLLPAAAWGLYRARAVGVPALVRRAFIAMLAVHAAFALRYNVVDQHMFFLPMYVLLCVFGGIGAAAAASRAASSERKLALAAAILLLLTPLFYATVASVARRWDLLHGIVHHKPYRDDYTYLLVPWSIACDSAEVMSREALRLAEPAGVVLYEDSMAEFALRYQAVRHSREGVAILPAAVLQQPGAEADRLVRAAVAGRRPVVLVPLNVNSPRTRPPSGEWLRSGDLYLLRLPDAAPASAPAPR